MAGGAWAATQISQLLSLDEASIQQVLDYTSALPKDAAAEHLKNLLGDSPKALEFISSYNARREPPAAPNIDPEPTKIGRKPHKERPPINKLPPPRQVESYGDTAGAYIKEEEPDYMAGKRRPQVEPVSAKTLALSDRLDAGHIPKSTPATSSRTPPSAAGHLISDLPNVRSRSRTSSRTSSPAPKTKINVQGGASMHGESTTLQDLDSAIRTLELQTNPSLETSSPTSRRCTCFGTRHPLLAAAPNCLSCGKIICVKEGLGPCTFCSTSLLSSEQIASMIDSLRQERGQERMKHNNPSHRRADLASAPTRVAPPSSNRASPSSANVDGTLDKALQHRNKLLSYQAENARRTHIIDEAADFETPTSGLSMWSSPMERAAQLKRQQKVLREQEWNAKPEYEKRRVVVSVDLVEGKVVRRMREMEKPKDDESDGAEDVHTDGVGQDGTEGGAFSRNPLLGSLIRPVWKGKARNADSGHGEEDKENRPRQATWRRVQDDNDDNEAVILNGGVYGGNDNERRLSDGEHACD